MDATWGTDLATTIAGEGQVAAFVAADRCSAECVGIHAALRAARLEALEPIRQGARRRFGAFARGIAAGLAVRHDHGSRYMADDFRKEPRLLGIGSSPAFVRAPEGNGCSGRFVRTPKENLPRVGTFDTVEELGQALLEPRETHNAARPIERHGFKPPIAVRQEQLPTAATAAQARHRCPTNRGRYRGSRSLADPARLERLGRGAVSEHGRAHHLVPTGASFTHW